MIAAHLDTETTGFCEPEHRIVEVYSDLIDMGARKRLHTINQRINPKRSMPIEAMRVHGIALSALANCPDWETFAPALHAQLQRADVLVAHNAEFDFNFLNMEFKRVKLPALTMPVFCTMENGIWATSTGKKPSLQELCFALGVTYDPSLAHAADYDVLRMEECVFKGIDFGFYDFDALLKANEETALPSRVA